MKNLREIILIDLNQSPKFHDNWGGRNQLFYNKSLEFHGFMILISWKFIQAYIQIKCMVSDVRCVRAYVNI